MSAPANPEQGEIFFTEEKLQQDEAAAGTRAENPTGRCIWGVAYAQQRCHICAYQLQAACIHCMLGNNVMMHAWQALPC